MITVCSVANPRVEPIHRIMIESLLAMSSMVSRVIVSLPAAEESVISDELCGMPITYRSFCPPYNRMSIGHAVGLHKAIALADTEYLLLCDPDVFFCMKGFDRFYLETMSDNGLGIVGVRHYQDGHAMGDFPTVINCLVRREELPGPQLCGGKNHYLRRCWEPGCDEQGQYPLAPDAYYLLCGCIPGQCHNYPHPAGYYDTGCKLYLWNHQRQGRWVSFGPGNGYARAEDYRANFAAPRLAPAEGPILYHQARVRKYGSEAFRAEWDRVRSTL